MLGEDGGDTSTTVAKRGSDSAPIETTTEVVWVTVMCGVACFTAGLAVGLGWRAGLKE